MSIRIPVMSGGCTTPMLSSLSPLVHRTVRRQQVGSGPGWAMTVPAAMIYQHATATADQAIASALDRQTAVDSRPEPPNVKP